MIGIRVDIDENDYLMKNVKHMWKRIPVSVWILIGIFLFGAFLRMYHFHDWMRFSPDEARDATFISNALSGVAPLPELGPQAGNTRFFLGPLYYQAEYASAFLFGNMPDSLAYPDLFFSLLAIPLLFFFLRKYFSVRTALILDALFSISFFAITSSRFASNPNSIPFFVILFLFSLLSLLDEGGKRKYIWATLLGLSMGVGIQLHTLLFLVSPAVAVIVWGYLIYRKAITWKHAALVILCFLLMNVGQLKYEFRHGGSNILQLFRGASSESSVGGNTLMRNIGLIASCQLEANAHILLAPIDETNCEDIFNVMRAGRKETFIKGAGPIVNGAFLLGELTLCLVLSVGGYILLWHRLQLESLSGKRNFLGVLLVYNILSFVVMLPVASQIEVHYFNILIVVPFVLLGLWMEYLLSSHWAHGKRLLRAMIVLLFVANGIFLARVASDYSEQRVSDSDNSILGEITPMVAYLIADSEGSDRVFIDGTTFYLKRFLKPFDFLSRQQGVQMVRPESDQNFPVGTRFFYINGTKLHTASPGETVNGDLVLAVRQFQQVTIYTLLKQP